MVEVNDGGRHNHFMQNEYDGTNRRIQVFSDFDGQYAQQHRYETITKAASITI